MNSNIINNQNSQLGSRITALLILIEDQKNEGITITQLAKKTNFTEIDLKKMMAGVYPNLCDYQKVIDIENKWLAELKQVRKDDKQWYKEKH